MKTNLYFLSKCMNKNDVNNLIIDSFSLGDYGTANVGGSSNPCMCGGASGSSQSRWQGGTTWKGNGVRSNHLDFAA
jgi:hypothetical protein